MCEYSCKASNDVAKKKARRGNLHFKCTATCHLADTVLITNVDLLPGQNLASRP